MISFLRSSLFSLVSNLSVTEKYKKYPIFDAVKGVFTGEFVSVPVYGSRFVFPVLSFDGSFQVYPEGVYSQQSEGYFAVRYKDVYAICTHFSNSDSRIEPPFSSFLEDTSAYINGYVYSYGNHGIVEYSVDFSLESAFSFIFDCVYSNVFNNVGYKNYLSYFTKTNFIDFSKPQNIRWRYEQFNFYCFVDGVECCYPDFSPIVKALGGSVVTDQSQNLKTICHLLGIDTNTALKDCDAMKEYLKRIVLNLGSLPLSEPNENLKSICYLLGVDTSENGLKDCALSKDYVKRNSIMLGAE